ncbi:uncharacterized protein LOC131876200 [Cryptomeria japonica]|uniref:uncharacterized protein LOC131876200 n=1 Tax=Cryptomeria japonica TaxID=3369 RepID=UPI0027DAA87D|nr:uncharacterized protein LOC131876200 [Cryptomeria japonica]
MGTHKQATSPSILVEKNDESREEDTPGLDSVWRDSGRSWTSLFEVKPSGKFSLSPVHNISNAEKGRFSIEILDTVIDHNINLMAMTLVGKFLGPRPNIDIVRAFAKCKWSFKGQVEITTMPKGALTLAFSCKGDMSRVLCDGPWLTGKAMLALQKWAPKMALDESFFIQASFWVRLSGLPLEF